MKYKKDVGYIKSPIPCGIEPFIIIDIKCVERLAKAIKSPLQARIESVLSILLGKIRNTLRIPAHCSSSAAF